MNNNNAIPQYDYIVHDFYFQSSISIGHIEYERAMPVFMSPFKKKCFFINYKFVTYKQNEFNPIYK